MTESWRAQPGAANTVLANRAFSLFLSSSSLDWLQRQRCCPDQPRPNQSEKAKQIPYTAGRTGVPTIMVSNAMARAPTRFSASLLSRTAIGSGEFAAAA